jgi:hypothetical protein
MSGKLTNVIRTEEGTGREGDSLSRWSWGNVAAVRENGEVFLEVTHGPHSHTAVTPGMLPSIALAAGDCLRAAAGNAPQAMCAGKSLYELLQEELFTVYERLASGTEAEDGRDPGRAEGMAYALAVFINPYAPNIEAVRTMCVEWWEQEEAA